MGEAKRRRVAGSAPRPRDERNVRVMKLIGFSKPAIEALHQRQAALNHARASQGLAAISFDQFFGAVVEHGLRQFDALRAQQEAQERLVKLPHEIRRTG